MKTFFTLIALLFVSTVAVAQTTTTTTTTPPPAKVTTAKLAQPPKDRSVAIAQTTTTLGILWLNDGHKNATAFSTPPLFHFKTGITWFDNNVYPVGFGAVTVGGATQLWGGTAIRVDAIKTTSGVSLSGYFGIEGGGSHLFVWGAGANIPI